ncbi:MAG: hypothetical protein ACHQT8_03705 [Chlamydiales bacterium]
MTAIHGSANNLALTTLVKDDGSVSLRFAPTPHSDVVTDLLTEEYERQLKQMDQPSEEQRLVARVAFESSALYDEDGKIFNGYRLANGAISLANRDGKIFEYRLIDKAKLDALTATLADPAEKTRVKTLITEIIQDVLAFRVVCIKFEERPHDMWDNPTPLKSIDQVTNQADIIRHFDFDRFFAGKFCTIKGSDYKILKTGFVALQVLLVQAKKADATPTTEQMKTVFKLEIVERIIRGAMQTAWINVNKYSSSNPSSLANEDWTPNPEWPASPSELVRLLEPEVLTFRLKDRMLRTVMSLERAGYKEQLINALRGIEERKSDGKTESSDKKDKT